MWAWSDVFRSLGSTRLDVKGKNAFFKAHVLVFFRMLVELAKMVVLPKRRIRVPILPMYAWADCYPVNSASSKLDLWILVRANWRRENPSFYLESSPNCAPDLPVDNASSSASRSESLPDISAFMSYFSSISGTKGLQLR